jgi:multiple sugar transport system permease protein
MAVHVRSRSRHRRQMNYGYVFIFPYLVLLLCFGVGPCIYAVFMSFSDPTSNAAFSFDGLTNYVTAFHDFRFWPAFENIFVYLLIWLPVMVLGVLTLALLLHARSGRFSSTMRFLYYLPGAVVGSASVLLWLFMLDPQISPFGPLLQLFGFKVIQDTIDPSHLPLVLAIMAFSNGAGGWIVIMYGAFQNIPQETMEAAAIDGCNAFQTAFLIKLPLIAKYIVYMIILSFATGTQVFVEPQLIGAAAGTGTISPTWSPNLLAYQFAFGTGNLGAAAAISMVLLIIGVVGAFLLIFRTNFFDLRLSKD